MHMRQSSKIHIAFEGEQVGRAQQTLGQIVNSLQSRDASMTWSMWYAKTRCMFMPSEYRDHPYQLAVRHGNKNCSRWPAFAWPRRKILACALLPAKETSSGPRAEDGRPSFSTKSWQSCCFAITLACKLNGGREVRARPTLQSRVNVSLNSSC